MFRVGLGLKLIEVLQPPNLQRPLAANFIDLRQMPIRSTWCNVPEFLYHHADEFGGKVGWWGSATKRVRREGGLAPVCILCRGPQRIGGGRAGSVVGWAPCRVRSTSL